MALATLLAPSPASHRSGLVRELGDLVLVFAFSFSSLSLGALIWGVGTAGLLARAAMKL